MTKTLKGLLLSATLLASLPAAAETFNATVAAGHPPVFRWVKMIDEAFVPHVSSSSP